MTKKDDSPIVDTSVMNRDLTGSDEGQKFLAIAALAGPHEAIVNQLQSGGSQMTSQRERLPTEGLIGYFKYLKDKDGELLRDENGLGRREVVDHKGRARQPWEAMGIKILGIDPEDDLFTKVELPEGWTIGPDPKDEYGKRSLLLDAKGAKRASIFYKAAYYERRASITPLCRYTLEHGLEDENNWEGSQWRYVIDNATGKTLFKAPTRTREEDYAAGRGKEMWDIAEKWLDDHYSEWHHSAAYWEDEA